MKGADLSTTIAGGETQGEPAIDGGGGCERGTPFFFFRWGWWNPFSLQLSVFSPVGGGFYLQLGGGLKDFLFSPLLGEMIQFD